MIKSGWSKKGWKVFIGFGGIAFMVIGILFLYNIPEGQYLELSILQRTQMVITIPLIFFGFTGAIWACWYD